MAVTRWLGAGALVIVAATSLAGCSGATDGDAADGAPAQQAPPELRASDIPVATTPPGGWTTPPPPVLRGCIEPLADGAPDLRGLWRAVSATRSGQPVPDGDRALENVQRVEQCGDRIVVTSSGIVHDMRADGTEANGVHDVAEFDLTTPITVVASYEDGVHVLRPVGVPVEVTRRRDDERMIWNYLGTEVTLERIAGPDDPFPGQEDT